MDTIIKPDNARLRVLKHLKSQASSLSEARGLALSRAVAGNNEFTEDDDPNKPPSLTPGMMQMYSYYAPGLQGGVYDIEVVQTVTHPKFKHPEPPEPEPDPKPDPTPDPKSDDKKDPTKPTDGKPPPVPLDKSKEIVLKSLQKFNVNAPRFSLPPGIVHHTYPPQGLGDHNNVLPHMVFEDPHLPWEQEASHIDHDEELKAAKEAVAKAAADAKKKADEASSTTEPSSVAAKPDTPDSPEKPADGNMHGRNMVPWLALLTFSEDEIKLKPNQLKPRSEGGFFPEGPPKVPPKSTPAPGTSGTQPSPFDRQQDKSTFAVKMTMDEYLDLGRAGNVDEKGHDVQVAIPIKDRSDEPIPKDQQVDVVFIPRDNFEDLFCSYTPDGSKPLVTDPNQARIPDLHRYKYLAHVRNINTKNMAGAGVEDEGLYSVIHGHRTGPLDLTEATPFIVHLVTLEGIEDHMRLPLKDPKTHIALVSLYSWTYLCLPPDSVNFTDTMRHIGNSISETGECWLRAPDAVIASIDRTGTAQMPTAFKSRLKERMSDGFMLQRYLLQTGEETISFYRGPLTPRYVPPITASWWPFQSNFSTDYQVLDSSLGIQDLTYSAAWQLGRTLGIADQAFSAALVRLRTAIQTTARRGVMKALAAKNVGNTKARMLAGLADAIDTVDALASAAPGENVVDPSNRFAVTGTPHPTFVSGNDAESNPVGVGEVHGDIFRTHVAATAVLMTSGQDPIPPLPDNSNSDDDEVFIPFSEINVPNSADWGIVQSWIMNNLFLKNIPAHYLIPDPSFLPRETIRFFYVDTNWMDAFIDGALSIGNHLDRSDDVVRQAFKGALNKYLGASYRTDHPDLNYFPQVPCFGFLMRSSVVKAFPNLEVHAPWPRTDDPGTDNEQLRPSREPVLRLETIDKDVLLCLFDRMPASPHWDDDLQIVISQPPHQQCFRLGGSGTVTEQAVEITFKHLFTTKKPPTQDLSHPERKFDLHQPLATINWTKGQAPDVPPLEANASDEKKAVHTKEEQHVKDSNLPGSIFDWGSRTIIFPAFAEACNEVLQNFMVSPPNNPYFKDDVSTSAVAGTMLTSYISQMKILVPKTDTAAVDAPPDTLKKPRHIRIQDDADKDPTTWKKVHPENHSKPAPPTPSTDVPTPDTTHLSPPVYPPLRPTRPGYINANAHPDIPLSERTQIPKNNKSLVLARDCGPQFIPKVYALHHPPPSFGAAATIPVYKDAHDPRNIPLDIVVTLTPPGPKDPIQQDTLHNLQLYTVDVDIPLGVRAQDLCAAYTGPGGKMLTNPRFNVHVMEKQAGSDVIRFTLVPRATTRLVPLRKIPEMNFVIWQVRPNGVPSGPVVGTRGAVEVLITENYRRMDSGVPFDHFGRSKSFLVKQLVA
ncbi:hypothetical protein EJ06DRAFT_554044 [Trichodelitschia bisporula]|uniref:Uncharacterized protein n=1 Tax=Trichodelitschia bisporula TaxID=703511 RepID=A0A6G1I6K0_9PEZI|nr:hypothetical protein EJ06DRAFT_554044 [Trichodelitschia bisporula]